MKSTPLYFLFDSVPLLICIRNNWLSQKDTSECILFSKLYHNGNHELVSNVRGEVMKVANWNICTLRDDGTQSLTVKILHEYGVGVACLSEVCLPDSGHSIRKVPESDCVYHLYDSGVEDNSGLYGVVMALSPLAQAALLAWEPISHRLATVRLKGAVVNVTVIFVYAPTLNAAGEDNDIFYRDLQAVVDRSPSTDLLVVAGDWNARNGPADENTRHVLGRFALGTRCDNGDHLVTSAVTNRLVVTNTRSRNESTSPIWS